MKTLNEIGKAAKLEYTTLKTKRDTQFNYLQGMLGTYRVFDKQVEESFIEELRKMTRLNDRLFTIEELLN